MLNARKALNKPQVDISFPEIEKFDHLPPAKVEGASAFVSIMEGCSKYCSYCVVPYTRGEEVSRPFEDVLVEVAGLADQGVKEVNLLGQNVNSWGLEKVGVALRKMFMDKDKFSSDIIPSNQSQYFKPEDTPPFVTLLRAVSKVEGIKKISFFTSNPWDFWDELIDEIASNPKIDRFIHLPVQSGSNRILKLMNRGYTRESYLSLINQIKAKVPEAVFGTDIIVGFPGETDADFNETLSLIKDVGFKVAFVARYSPRPGTASARLYPDDVPAKVKKQRWEILDQIANKDNLKSRPIVP